MARSRQLSLSEDCLSQDSRDLLWHAGNDKQLSIRTLDIFPYPYIKHILGSECPWFMFFQLRYSNLDQHVLAMLFIILFSSRYGPLDPVK